MSRVCAMNRMHVLTCTQSYYLLGIYRKQLSMIMCVGRAQLRILVLQSETDQPFD